MTTTDTQSSDSTNPSTQTFGTNSNVCMRSNMVAPAEILCPPSVLITVDRSDDDLCAK
jgi:hypothetical protein